MSPKFCILNNVLFLENRSPVVKGEAEEVEWIESLELIDENIAFGVDNQ